MRKIEIGNRKAECWSSPWRGVGVARSGRPLRYIQLTVEEMFIAAKTGQINVPDGQIPEVVRRQRDRMEALAGFEFDETLLREVSLS